MPHCSFRYAEAAARRFSGSRGRPAWGPAPTGGGARLVSVELDIARPPATFLAKEGGQRPPGWSGKESPRLKTAPVVSQSERVELLVDCPQLLANLADDL